MNHQLHAIYASSASDTVIAANFLSFPNCTLFQKCNVRHANDRAIVSVSCASLVCAFLCFLEKRGLPTANTICCVGRAV